MSFLSEMENIIKANGERGLDIVLNYHGMDLELYRPESKDNVYSRVHARNAGGPVILTDKFTGAIVGDDYFPTTEIQAGIFKKAWLFAKEPRDIRPGDEIRVVRQDGKRMAYRVEEKPSIGQTTEVFTKWELSGIM